MLTLVALWRGINVGKAKRIAMAELRALLEDLGYADVRTVLNSGNAVLRCASGCDPSCRSDGGSEDLASAAGRMRGAVLERLGVDARVQLVNGRAFREAVERNPKPELAEADPSRFLVHFLSERPGADVVELAAEDWGEEFVALVGSVVYVHSPGGVLKSRAGKALARALGDGVTARNWKTVLRIRELF